MNRKRITLMHVLGWTLLIVGSMCRSYFSNQFEHEPFSRFLLIELGYYLVSGVCFYLSYFLVAPLILKRKYPVALTLTLLTFILVVLTRFALEFGFFKPTLHFDNYRGRIPTLSYYLSNIFYFYFPSYFVYGLLSFLAERWFDNQQRQQELEKERLNAELAFLRSQVNPHFLFNTINDIYSLSYKQSPLAPEALLKLSVILRYMLRDGSEEFMPLNRELEYLENVVELQQIASKGSAYITFMQEGYVGEQPVASLLFIAFVENAFKHGVLDSPNTPVEIHLKADISVVEFKVENKKSHSLEDTTAGIGLKNVRRRLELMYPGRHVLRVSDEEDTFIVELMIKLN
jgi:two-component system LytT family sensor kinase